MAGAITGIIKHHENCLPMKAACAENSSKAKDLNLFIEDLSSVPDLAALGALVLTALAPLVDLTVNRKGRR